MREMEIMDLFKKSGAYLQGHFKLSSGLHSAAYLQCALLLQNPVVAGRVCSVLALKFEQDKPDVVVGPAMGGVIFAYELARELGARAVFTERDSDGAMALKRGFTVEPGDRVLIAEDVLTTGKSVKEVIRVLKARGVTPVGMACLVDRSASVIDLGGIKHESLIKLNIPVFEERKCPLCKEGLPVVKPGSRKI